MAFPKEWEDLPEVGNDPDDSSVGDSNDSEEEVESRNDRKDLVIQRLVNELGIQPWLRLWERREIPKEHLRTVKVPANVLIDQWHNAKHSQMAWADADEDSKAPAAKNVSRGKTSWEEAKGMMPNIWNRLESQPSFRHMKTDYEAGSSRLVPWLKSKIELSTPSEPTKKVTRKALEEKIASLETIINKSEEELKHTDTIMTDFTGNGQQARGVLTTELMVESKTLRTAFFVVDADSHYNLLLGHDWIHANKYVPSTLHRKLFQRIEDRVEEIKAEGRPYMVDIHVEEIGHIN
uniref:Uncharacterized protein n=1 Tax=Ananas comosus var. bracteatus TaxID=296719 RepID=A0A6V7PSU9_ANACO|nr:unnamed protein product [Ananas comosus var. bracteatus]